MKKMYYVALATLVAAFSCAKEANLEKEQAPVQGHAVTLGVEIPTTKIANSNPGNAIHPVWQDGDQIEVVFGTTSEIFTLASGAGTQSATFTNGSSKLKDSDTYDVYYPRKDYDWSEQDGSLAKLPNYLVSTGNTGVDAKINLEPQLTYFVLDLNKGEAQNLTLDNAYFYNSTTPFVVDSEGNTGEIKITPATAFNYDAGVSSNAKIYVAVKTAGTTTGNTIGVDIQNGDHYAGVEGYTLTWEATKEYESANAYSKISTASDLKYNSGLVGKTDNSSGWDAVRSNAYTIPEGKTLELEFTNYGPGTEAWHNWVFCVNDGDGNDYFYLTCANNSWGDTYHSARRRFIGSTGDIPVTAGDWWWDYFRANMNGAKVNITLERTKHGSLLVTTNSYIPNSDVVYFEKYSHLIPAGKSAKVQLLTDQSHYQMKSISSYDSTTELSYLTNNAPYYVYDKPLNIETVGYTLCGHYSEWYDGDQIADVPMDAALLSGTITGTIPATEGIQQLCNTTYNEENIPFKVKVANGLSEIGVPDYTAEWNTTGWSPYPYFGEIETGETITLKFELYAPDTDNYRGIYTQLCSEAFSTWYITTRMDNYGWDSSYAACTKESNWNWGTEGDYYRKHLTRSNVVLAITRDSNTTATIRYDVTYSDGEEKHYQEYSNITFDTTTYGDKLAYRYTADGAYAVITDFYKSTAE